MKNDDLIQRLTDSTGPDEELGRQIICTLIAPKGSYVEQSKRNGVWCIYDGVDHCDRPRLWEWRGFNELRKGDCPTRYPDGLPACIRLMDEVLPGWLWEMHWNGRTHSVALIPGADEPSYRLPKLTGHKSLSHALLIAILRAQDASQ